MPVFLGLMVGSSTDGIDAALIDSDRHHCTLIDACTVPLSTTIRQAILEFSMDQSGGFEAYITLDVKMGHLLAEAAEHLITQAGIDRQCIQAIGVHGSTGFHDPIHSKSSLQLGDPNIIAATVGCPVVSDFRRADIAAGGQGAPLVPAFHQYLCQRLRPQLSEEGACVNIGGMANLSAWSQAALLGFDTGPGNVLMDAWIQHHQQQPYDRHGEWASTGQVHDDLLAHWQHDPYFKAPWPKSTSRQYFNLNWIQSSLKDHPKVSPESVQATLVALTAWSITQGLEACVSKAVPVWVCGGGVHNLTLMTALQTLNQAREIHSIEHLGWAPDVIEAAAFAWLAQQRIEHHALNLCQVTGARQPMVLGGLYGSGESSVSDKHLS